MTRHFQLPEDLMTLELVPHQCTSLSVTSLRQGSQQHFPSHTPLEDPEPKLDKSLLTFVISICSNIDKKK